MKRVTRLEVFLMLDCHKKVPLQIIELGTDMKYIVDIPPEDLRFFNHIAIHIVTNEEECL